MKKFLNTVHKGAVIAAMIHVSVCEALLKFFSHNAFTFNMSNIEKNPHTPHWPAQNPHKREVPYTLAQGPEN